MGDWFERLFEVKHEKQTLKKFFSFVLFIILGSSVYIVMTYQNYRYDEYSNEYGRVEEALESYKEIYGVYPLGSEVNWKDERRLKKYFSSNNFTRGEKFYYIDLKSLDLTDQVKRTYLIDIDRDRLYTSEFVIYDMRRWHIPGAK